MIHPCDKLCGNKTASGYCATTVCINPKYSNIGTVQYGQGVQKRIVSNADRIRAMTDEELAELIGDNIDCAICKKEVFETTTCPGSLTADGKDCYGCWLDWLRQEVES